MTTAVSRSVTEFEYIVVNNQVTDGTGVVSEHTAARIIGIVRSGQVLDAVTTSVKYALISGNGNFTSAAIQFARCTIADGSIEGNACHINVTGEHGIQCVADTCVNQRREHDEFLGIAELCHVVLNYGHERKSCERIHIQSLFQRICTVQVSIGNGVVRFIHLGSLFLGNHFCKEHFTADFLQNLGLGHHAGVSHLGVIHFLHQVAQFLNLCHLLLCRSGSRNGTDGFCNLSLGSY